MSPTKHYTIVYLNQEITNCTVSYSWDDLFNNLYKILYHHHYQLSYLSIICYYLEIPTTYFNVTYQNGLVLSTGKESFRISSLYPEYHVCDLKLAKYYGKNDTCSTTSTPRNSTPKVSTTKASTPKISTPKISTPEQLPILTNKRPVKKELPHTQTSTETTNSYQYNPKWRIFESDKHSYFKMKNDIVNGLFETEQINPDFVWKYKIFNILEQRDKVDFSSNQNLKEEYNLFTELYNVCLEEEEEQPPKISQVHVPHNYNYMSDEKKNEYAKKYKLTREQFEEQYVNNNIN